MGKMPHIDWKQWATIRPEWIHEDTDRAFKRFVEQKWKDALNVAAVELANWRVARVKSERPVTEKQAGGPKKAIKPEAQRESLLSR
jgi:hypothetical protein